jgi:O-antigen ligase
VVAAVLFVLVLVVALGARGRINALKSLLLALLGIAIMLAALPGVLDKTIDKTEKGNALSFRDKIWSNALIEWRRFPIFGVGMGNFGHVTSEQLQDWNKTRDWAIQPEAEGMAPHAHSLYVTALAERGVVGLGVLIAVLLAWGAALLRSVPLGSDPAIGWALFGAALAGCLITVVVGFFNTTLHHEHGIVSVLLFGLWLSHRAARGRADRASPQS